MLGALPDALIVGVAGLGGGPREEVQHELAVGIGTLAGSTVCVRTLYVLSGMYGTQQKVFTGTNMLASTWAAFLRKHLTLC